MTRKKIVSGLLVCLLVLGMLAGLAANGSSTQYDSISFSVNSIVMGINDTYTLEVTSTPSGVKASELNWSSDDTRVASVSNGVIRSNRLYGGTIITATTKDGRLTARCYVGVGAPYGYSGGYYNGYYPGDYYYYNGNYNSNWYYDYYYPNYYYPYGSVYYNDYYNNGYYDYYYPYDYSTYINRDGRIVYSVNKTNPETIVRPGRATSSQTFALEVQQNLNVTYKGSSVGFGFINNSSALTVTPETTGYDVNAISLPRNTMNRMNRFGFGMIRYRLPDLETGIYPELVGDGALNLTVERVTSSSLDNVVGGPWKLSAESSEEALTLRFILDAKYSRSQLQLMKLGSDGTYVEMESSMWTLLRATAGDGYTYSVRTEKVTPGTYALVKVG